MYSKKLNLLFIHIPKCAGTSIIEAVRKVDKTADHGHKTWKFYDAYEIHSKKPKTFSIVRNPWDRVFSCYNYARKTESFWHGTDKQYGVHPDFELLSNYDFKDCVKILYNNKQLLDLPEGQRRNFKHNWNYQLPYIYTFKDGHAASRVEQVLRFEHIDEVSGWLNDLYNLDIKILNTSTIGENYKDHYDDETIDLVYQIYKRDIDILKYKFE